MAAPIGSGHNPFRLVLRRAAVPTAIAGVATAVILWIVRDLTAFWSGLVGAGIAVAFFVSGMLMMSKFVRSADPMLFMAVGMATYFGQIIVLFGVLVVARQIEALDSWSAGVAMLVSIVVWQVAQVVAWRQARVPIYDEPAPDAAEGAS
ncbi:hypothetical protein [Demetria terragena]|uniref:hypothetical protein n=1 Tax=Demetria terragena TaxID=63959 RepID=UPI0003622E3B|nr:hypothetical protein [Demetria terragena]